VSFRVAAKRRGRRCDVITLRLAPLDLELLGAQVKTSHISLDVFARKAASSATCSARSPTPRSRFRASRAR
jgi:hypothetical protein